MFAALAGGAFGCELIATVDRNKIDGVGGAGGEATTTTTSTSSTSTSTSTTTTSTSTGMGECAKAEDCPDPGNACVTRTCTNNMCGTSPVATGTTIAAQTTGDCQSKQCDGAGAIVSVPDNTDVPVDAKQCTDDLCAGGVPSNPNTMSGASCTAPANGKCDGKGACVECLVASTCPGMDTECSTRTCTAGVCGVSLVPAGTATATQTAGDCKKATCNGAGSTASVNDDTDVPNDSNACTGDVCTAGVPSHPLQPVGTACGAGQTCNATGICTGCTMASDCPLAANPECATRTCTASACGFTNTMVGTATTAQAAGDCKKNVCDGLGGITPSPDNTDVPVDNNQCTGDVCTAGVPSNPPTAANTPCSQMGGSVCTGAGVCVQCLAAASCPGVDTDCKPRACTAGVCGFNNTAAGTPTTTQTVGDCKENQCDGSGASAPAAKNTDVPVDNNQCTNDVCTAGVPSNPPSAAGTSCSQMSGAVCDGNSVCVGCVVGADCPSGVCTGNVCAMPSCTDLVKNGAETGVDCGGGTCPACATGKPCTANSDCTSGTCTGNVCSLLNGCDMATATDVTATMTTMVTFANGNLTYAPNCLKVKAGTDVTFNGNFAGHPLQGGTVVGNTVTPAATGPFATLTNTGSTATFTMSSTGSYPYYCTSHALAGMTGAIFVVP